MVEKSKSDIPKIGYLYHYPKLDHPTEKFRLDIFISSIPTEQHFDVLRTRMFIANPNGVIEPLTIGHPWNNEKSARVCAGLVTMEDRKGKKEEAFTFGGQLKIEVQELQTACILVSTAPILEISGVTPRNRFFVEEMEIVLAEYQARYSDHEKYEKNICKIDPYQLYLACLGELTEKFESFPQKGENYQQLLVHLHSQRHRLAKAGLIKGPLPTLGEILE